MLELPEEAYFEADGVSQSMLKTLGEEGGPARVRYGTRRETPAQKFGSLIHTTILQPDLLERRYVATDLERAGTKKWDAEEIAAMGRIMIKRPQYDEARAIRDAVYRWSDVARLLMPGGLTEVSFFWRDPSSGVDCKARADMVNLKHRVMLDIKSAIDASYRGFRRAAREYSYDIQDAHYLDGYPNAGGPALDAFVFIAVEKVPPYLAAAYEIPQEDRAKARVERQRLIGIYQQCTATDHWPGYEPGLQILSLNRRED